MAGVSRRDSNKRLQLLKSQVATAKTVKNLSKEEQGAWLGKQNTVALRGWDSPGIEPAG